MRRWQLIAQLCRTHGLRRGVELGVREGRFTKHILLHVPGSHMTGVDSWCALPTRDQPGAETYERWPMARYRAEALALAGHFPGRCRMLEMTTDEAARVVPDSSVDFVFVDADHTEEANFSLHAILLLPKPPTTDMILLMQSVMLNWKR